LQSLGCVSGFLQLGFTGFFGLFTGFAGLFDVLAPSFTPFRHNIFRGMLSSSELSESSSFLDFSACLGDFIVSSLDLDEHGLSSILNFFFLAGITSLVLFVVRFCEGPGSLIGLTVTLFSLGFGNSCVSGVWLSSSRRLGLLK
jgi:hypothetical protein